MDTSLSNEFDLRPNRMDTFLERLAEKMGLQARASTVFGEPVDRDGVTVIPVAKARWGFGGGGGAGKRGGAESGSGSGGGGGMILTPVGYIEVKAGASRFQPIWDPGARRPLLMAGIAVALWSLRCLARRNRER
jgi:uncharacterized spore protein YtfJ